MVYLFWIGDVDLGLQIVWRRGEGIKKTIKYVWRNLWMAPNRQQKILYYETHFRFGFQV